MKGVYWQVLIDGVLISGCQSRYKQKLEPVGLLFSCFPYFESNSRDEVYIIAGSGDPTDIFTSRD